MWSGIRRGSSVGRGMTRRVKIIDVHDGFKVTVDGATQVVDLLYCNGESMIVSGLIEMWCDDVYFERDAEEYGHGVQGSYTTEANLVIEE